MTESLGGSVKSNQSWNLGHLGPLEPLSHFEEQESPLSLDSNRAVSGKGMRAQVRSLHALTLCPTDSHAAKAALAMPAGWADTTLASMLLLHRILLFCNGEKMANSASSRPER